MVGKFVYEGLVKVEIEDRTLAHLQVVIANKLRRGEGFNFTWKGDADLGEGRTCVWVHSGSALVYKFYGSRRPSLNPAWLDALAQVANSTGGLYLVAEPPLPMGGAAGGPAEPEAAS